MKSGKVRRNSGRVIDTPSQATSWKEDEDISVYLQEYWNDWIDWRDGFRAWRDDKSRFRNPECVLGRWYPEETKRLNSKLKRLETIKKAKRHREEKPLHL